MKRISLLSFILTLLCSSAFAQKPDPNFYIFLCFGQSNMEGGVPAEGVDMEYVDPRFQVLATDATNPNRALGEWYTAYPCIVGLGGLCPIDYFGRSMVAALPADYKVGVVAVASGFSRIQGRITFFIKKPPKSRNMTASYTNDL